MVSTDTPMSPLMRIVFWFVAANALAGALSLIGLAFSNSLVGFIIAWTLVQVSYNFAQGPLSAVMPDRVPLAINSFPTPAGGLPDLFPEVPLFPHEHASRPRRRTSARLSAESLLEGLNPPQREAVLHEGAPVLVVAGAG